MSHLILLATPTAAMGPVESPRRWNSRKIMRKLQGTFCLNKYQNFQEKFCDNIRNAGNKMGTENRR